MKDTFFVVPEGRRDRVVAVHRPLQILLVKFVPQNEGRMTMDAPQRTRSCRRDQPTATTSQSRGSRQICLPLDRRDL